jgi:hypothetical protein
MARINGQFRKSVADAAHDLGDVVHHSTAQAAAPRCEGDYCERAAQTETGIEWFREIGKDGEGMCVPLTNFLARIVSDITLDDGAETTRALVHR